MSSGRVLRLALLLLVTALLLPALQHLKRDVSDDPLELWADRLMSFSFVLFGLAVVLALLEKGGVRVSGNRCRDCRKPIEHGKIFCRDHLKSRIEAAREKYRGERGMGL